MYATLGWSMLAGRHHHLRVLRDPSEGVAKDVQSKLLREAHDSR